MSSTDKFLGEIERLVGSDVLHGSESLCKLLRYLARQAVDNPGIPVKEYQIATEVFGRPADFDPQSDSAIRVQAGRLRSKLAEFYASEGADDPVIVELPKGTYALSFHLRAGTNGHRHRPGFGTEITATAAPTPSQQPTHKWRTAFLATLVLLVASLVAIILLARNQKLAEQRQTEADKDEGPPAALRIFWQPFISAPEGPWIIFSNAAFVGRPEIGMRYFDPQKDGPGQLWDHYTGVGEVLAVHNLDQVFASLHKRVRVKRGSLFSLDDANNNDLVFVGSPSENLTLGDLPGTKEFVFHRVTTGPRKGDLGILNNHPQTGEPLEVVATPSGSVLAEDYAVVGFMPGLDPSRSIMVLAGTTTFGTQAAVEFVTRADSLSNLLSRLSVLTPGSLLPFEALLHVKVSRGVPVETQVIAVRKR